jgi:lysophospholipase L1-like esterase
MYSDRPMETNSETSTRNSRILCFGDSLTTGYCQDGWIYAPYAKTLSSELQTPADWVGFSGWTTQLLVDNMHKKTSLDGNGFEKVNLVPQLDSSSYSSCIIMAGTNDLCLIYSVEKIFSNLKTLHEVCHQRSIRTVGIGIPGSGFQEGCDEAAKKSHEVSLMLKQWIETLPKGRAMYMEFPIPFSRSSSNWESDGLHLSESGYAELGKLVAAQIKSFVQSE